MSTTLQPIQPAERQPLLDILRGYALLGVVVMNYGYIAGELDNGEVQQWTFTPLHLLFAYLWSHKSYSMLSFLFGYGFGLLLDNLRLNSPKPGQVFLRRMGWLFLIGLVNGLVWEGDILKPYAIFGLLIWFCRTWSLRKVLRAGLALLLVNVVLRYLLQLFPVFPEAATQAYTAQFTEAYRGGSFAEFVRFNLSSVTARPFYWFNMLTDLSIPGLMLLGLAGSRSNFLLDWERHGALLRKLCLWGGIIGVAFGALSWAFLKIEGMALETPWKELRRVLCFQTLNRYGMALFYLGGFAWLYHSGKRWVRAFAPVGRMALTNYLVQSIAMTLAFSGAFFGGANHLPLFSMPLIGMGVFVIQLIYSPLWLRRFRYGPVEWLWRRLVYGASHLGGKFKLQAKHNIV